VLLCDGYVMAAPTFPLCERSGYTIGLNNAFNANAYRRQLALHESTNNMPNFFRLFSEYFWAVACAFSAFNYWNAKRGILNSVSPERVAEAQAYLRNFAIAGVLPWTIMGMGQLSGTTPTVWYYFRPQDGNVFVVAWLAFVFLLSASFAWWVFLAGGATKVVEYNLLAAVGRRSVTSPSEGMVKFFAVLYVITSPIWVYGVISMNVGLPR
jgi:hypothetical protein